MSFILKIAKCIFLSTILTAYSSHERFLDRIIKGPTTLTSEWTESAPKPPLKPKRDVQGIVILVDKAYIGELVRDGAFRLTDSTLIKPEVQLVDVNGNTFDLKLNGAFGNDRLLYSVPDELKSKQFQKVRLRSDRTISCKKIFWRCYYFTDIE